MGKKQHTDTMSAKKKILITDDESTIVEVYKRLIERCRDDVEVLVAYDGHEAWRLIDQREGQIDLVATDLRMPSMSGVQLAQRIKAKYPAVKTLLVSGSLRPGQLDENKEIIDGFLERPFGLGRYIELIDNLLGS